MTANMDIIRAEWQARTLAEYRAAAVAGEFLCWLIRLGFSPEVLQEAHRVVGNELRHAELCFEVYQGLGGDGDPLDVAEGCLVAHQGVGKPTFQRLVLACLDTFCIGGTLAQPLFEAMQSGATEAAPRQALDRIVGDGVAHVDFAWKVLDEAMEQDKKVVKGLAKTHLPSFFGKVEKSWGLLPEGWVEPVGPEELRHGLMPRVRYKRAFYQAVAEDLLPRLDSRNLPGRAAWGKRPRADK